MKNYTKIIAITSFGSFFELFDYMCFAYLSTIISQVFYPKTEHKLALIYVFIIFSVGYISRILGGFIFSHFGDKQGRKNIFSISIIFMALPSFLIGIMPSYEKIGFFSPLLLVILRFTQGLALGGEVSGAITFLSELVNNKIRAVACATLSFAANLGVIFAALFTSFLISHVSTINMLQWGWRIPFLTGGVLSLIGFYIRKKTSESDLFSEIKKQGKIEKIPIQYAFKMQRKKILLLMILPFVVGLTTSTFHIYFPSYLITYKNFIPKEAFLFTSLAIGVMAISSLLFAHISNIIGRKPLFCFGTLIISLITFLGQFSFMSSKLMIIILLISLSFFLAMVNGTYMVVIAETFETKIRYTCSSITYTCGVLMGAGFTPFILTYSIEKTNNQEAPYIIVSIALLFIFFITRFIPETKNSNNFQLS